MVNTNMGSEVVSFPLFFPQEYCIFCFIFGVQFINLTLSAAHRLEMLGGGGGGGKLDALGVGGRTTDIFNFLWYFSATSPLDSGRSLLQNDLGSGVVIDLSFPD